MKGQVHKEEEQALKATYLPRSGNRGRGRSSARGRGRERQGSIKLEIGGIVLIVTGVFWIPELKNNLLSVGQLQEKGLTVQFKDNFCKVYHDRRGLLFK